MFIYQLVFKINGKIPGCLLDWRVKSKFRLFCITTRDSYGDRPHTTQTHIQSLLTISKPKGLSEIPRENKSSNHSSQMNMKFDSILKMWKRGEIAPLEHYLLSYIVFCYLILGFHFKTGIRFSLRDKRLFEVSEVEITRVDCTYHYDLSHNVRKLTSDTSAQWRFRSSCACTKYHLDLWSPVIHSVVASGFVSRQWSPWSDCADAQADLGLRCTHMPEDTFSPGAKTTSGTNA